MEGANRPAVGTLELPTSLYIACSALLTVLLLALLWYLYRRDQRQFWHHAVRLPSRMQQPYWYLISISTGCRPWAGHEGDIFVRLVGSKFESRTFIINGEVHSRLWEADSHLYLYSSSFPLGDINYVILACRASPHRKRWYLSSVQIKYVTQKPEKQQIWYFPYHEWIEVFFDPVRVTLCAVNDAHDINRRLMLGWLGRSFTDFHLWTSVFGPLKYTPFRRNERVLCISAEVLGSLVSCSFLNVVLPNIGVLALGIFGASCAMLPASSIEAVLRRVERRYKILLEDIKWYKVAEHGFGDIDRPKTYRQYRLKPTHKKMNYQLMFQNDKEEDAATYQGLKEIIEDDNKFWNWLDPSIPLLLPPPEMRSVSSFAVSSKFSFNASVNEEDEDYSDKEEETLMEEVWSFIKKCFGCEQPIEGPEPKESVINNVSKLFVNEAPVEQVEVQEATEVPMIVEEFIQPITINQEFISNHEFDDAMAAGDEGFEDDEPPRKPKKPLLHVGQGYVVRPNAVWKVDSDYSISNYNMTENNLDDFNILESMPAAEFRGFKYMKEAKKAGFTDSELKVRYHLGYNRRGGVEDLRETVSSVGDNWGHEYLQSDSEIQLPDKINQLSLAEYDLVNWVYYDRCVHGNKWLKKKTPLAAVLLTNEADGGIREIDWYGVDVDSMGEDEFDTRKYAEKFRRSKEYEKKRDAVRELRAKYPEPVPRERVFNMLIFPEYTEKLMKAFEELIFDPESWSALAELYAELAECDDGPTVFSEAIICVSKIPDGEKIVRNIMSCARSSCIWPILICEVTQRLRYQGDNVDRLKEKYGLENGCLFNSPENSAQGDYSTRRGMKLFNMPKNIFGSHGTKGDATYHAEQNNQSVTCVYTELQLLLEWRQKLHEQEIPLKGCPMNELKEEELKVLSKFYYSMLKTPEGCGLFGELLRQVTLSNDKGRSMVCRKIRYIAGHDSGVPLLNDLLKAVASSGHDGKLLIVRIFSMVEMRKPNGHKVIKKLADALGTVETGRFLLKDLQIDVACAHRRAHEVRREIRKKLDPLIRMSRKSYCRMVISLNAIAKYMLGVADNSRKVLAHDDKDGPQGFGNIPNLTTNRQQAVNNERWKSDRKCCKTYDGPPEVEKNLAKLEEKESSLQLSDSSTIPSFVSRYSKHTLVSDLWRPVDDRDDIVNIYRRKQEPVVHSKLPPHEGEECNSDFPCDRKRLLSMNEFFLKSKDYESFSMNFKYQKKYRDFEYNYHHDSPDSDEEIEKCWKPTSPTFQQTEFYLQSIEDRIASLEKVCVEWGKDYRQNPDNWKTMELCTCHREMLGDKKKKDQLLLKSFFDKHNCFICKIAADLEDAKDPDDIINILSSECEDIPAKSLSQLHHIPVLERQTIENIQQQYSKKKHPENKPGDLASESGQNSSKGKMPFPSGHGANFESPHNILDGLSSQTYPNCGTRKENLCQCVGGLKKGMADRPRSWNKERVFSQEESLPRSDEENKGIERINKCGKITIIPPLKIQPDTAMRRRLEAEHPPTHESEDPNSNQKTLITICPYANQSEKPKETEPEVSNDSDKCAFSTRLCEKCGKLKYLGGVQGSPQDAKLQKDNKEWLDNGEKLPENLYLSSKGENPRQIDSETENSSSVDLDGFVTQPSDSFTSRKNANGCCNTSGCYPEIPHKTHFRHKNVNTSFPEEDNSYLQWLEKLPCGNACNNFNQNQPDCVKSKCKKHIKTKLHSSKALKTFPSTDSQGRHNDPSAKTPIIAKFQNAEEVKHLLEEICTICKYPKFSCCDGGEKRTQVYCKCEQVTPVKKALSNTSSHSMCSQCHIRVGTQQTPPTNRYLLPLKIVRCYEEALARLRKKPVDVTDSGVSLHTAIDIHGDYDAATANEHEQLVLLDLMGLGGRPDVKRRRKRCKTVEKNCPPKKVLSEAGCSECSTTSSSGVCCHVRTSRVQPVLHLQGYICRDESDQECQKFKPLSLKWWKKHEFALKSIQMCADSCVSLSVLLAKDRMSVKTEHERTCQVCTFVGINHSDLENMNLPADGAPLGPRYSQFLPKIWRSEIRTMGQQGERSHITENRRPRFYKQVVTAIVESTKMLLLTPDLNPDRLMTQSVYDHLLVDDSSEGSNIDLGGKNARERKENYVTKASASKLSHFRAMMKCLNDIQRQGTLLRHSRLVSDKDVTVATILEQQKDNEAEDEDESEKTSKDEKQNLTLIDLIINFIKNNACGSVLDCVELLETPWELPVDQQHISGRLLKKIDSVISGISESSRKAVQDCEVWEESLGCIVDAYLAEVVFRAIAQNDVFKAIRRGNFAKKHMEKLVYNTRLTIARLVRFAEMTQAATANLKDAVREGLTEAEKENVKRLQKSRAYPTNFYSDDENEDLYSDDETQTVKHHIKALLRTGRDDRRATLDDVMISFERLRRNINDDLTEAATVLKKIADLGDDNMIWTRNTVNAEPLRDINDRNDNLKCWGDSEWQNLNSNKRKDNKLFVCKKVPSFMADENGPKTNGKETTHRGDASSIVSGSGISAQTKTKTQVHVADGIRHASKTSEGCVVEDVIVPHVSTGARHLSSPMDNLQDDGSYEEIGTCRASTSKSQGKDETLWPDTDNSSTHTLVCAQCPGPSAGVNGDNNLLLDMDVLEEQAKKRRAAQEGTAVTKVARKRGLPREFHSVFKLTSTTNFEPEKHAREALQAEKGKGMLQHIFGTDMTEIEMVDAFHNNIKTLLSWQNSSINRTIGRLAKLLLFLLVVGCGIGACLLPVYFFPADFTLLSAIPVAIISCVLILEPLKCLVVAWILFWQRHRPAFHNNPVFMKSNPTLLQRARLSRPKLTDEFQIIADDADQYDLEPQEGSEEYYNKFCDNRARSQIFDRRRRVLPVLTENDIPADLDAVKSNVCVEEVDENLLFEPYLALNDSEGRRLSVSSECASVTVPDKPADVSNTNEFDTESLFPVEMEKRTPMIHCVYSNLPLK